MSKHLTAVHTFLLGCLDEFIGLLSIFFFPFAPHDFIFLTYRSHFFEDSLFSGAAHKFVVVVAGPAGGPAPWD